MTRLANHAHSLLLVEDSDDERESLEMLLELAGYRVDAVRSALQAAAAHELELRPDRSFQTEPVLILLHVHRELDRRHDPVAVPLLGDVRRREGAGELRDRLPVTCELELHDARPVAKILRKADRQL